MLQQGNDRNAESAFTIIIIKWKNREKAVELSADEQKNHVDAKNENMSANPNGSTASVQNKWFFSPNGEKKLKLVIACELNKVENKKTHKMLNTFAPKL